VQHSRPLLEVERTCRTQEEFSGWMSRRSATHQAEMSSQARRSVGRLAPGRGLSLASGTAASTRRWRADDRRQENSPQSGDIIAAPPVEGDARVEPHPHVGSACRVRVKRWGPLCVARGVRLKRWAPLWVARARLIVGFWRQEARDQALRQSVQGDRNSSDADDISNPGQRWARVFVATRSPVDTSTP
jgi:hypothetical protein